LASKIGRLFVVGLEITIIASDIHANTVSSVRWSYFCKKLHSDARVNLKVIDECPNLFIFNKIFSQSQYIFITMPPFWTILKYAPFLFLMKILYRKANLIFDFRDPWSFNIGTNYSFDRSTKIEWSIKYIVAIGFEKFAHFLADCVIVTTSPMINYYEKIGFSRQKMLLIENGYDEFVDSKPKDKKSRDLEKVSVMFSGKLFEYSHEEAIFCVQYILDSYDSDSIIFNCCGSDTEYFKLKSYLPSEVEVNSFGYLPYDAFINKCCKSDIGIVIVRCDDMYYGTKLFDYLGCGLRVIACSSKNSALFRRFARYPNITWIDTEGYEVSCIPTMVEEEIQELSRKSGYSILEKFLLDKKT